MSWQRPRQRASEEISKRIDGLLAAVLAVFGFLRR
jgi:hypothetical protein